MTVDSILFRCDGSPEIGLGHVVRCLALADELSERHGCRIAFAMRPGLLGVQMVEQKGYHVLIPRASPSDSGQWLKQALREAGARTLVLDVRDDLPMTAVGHMREEGTLIVTLDDPSERRLAADLAFYPPVPQVKRMDWTGFDGRLFVGWEWVVLRREFADRPPRVANEHPVILVTMGASDPAGLTLEALKALDLLHEEFDARILVGPGFLRHAALMGLLAVMRRSVNVLENATDVYDVMAGADLAMASFGMTAYELAAMGVPTIYLCLTQDHAESASAFADALMGVSAGLWSQVTPSDLARRASTMLHDLDGWRARLNSRFVDGLGTHRVAAEMVDSIRGGR